MQAQTHVNPWWAALSVWGVVNAVNVLQALREFVHQQAGGNKDIRELK